MNSLYNNMVTMVNISDSGVLKILKKYQNIFSLISKVEQKLGMIYCSIGNGGEWNEKMKDKDVIVDDVKWTQKN